MQTALPEQYRRTPKGRRAEDILRSCVHCGFCNATCPTYQVVGDELDGPRGRIYLMKEMLETQTVDPIAGHHLDRCLTCRACETTCPSGVAYGELLEVARDFQTRHAERGLIERLIRGWLLRVVPYPERFRRWARLGRAFAWLLPRKFRQQLPGAVKPQPSVTNPEQPSTTVLVLQGCVQRVATPEVNAALHRLLMRNGVAVIYAENETCCGGLPMHLGEEAAARELVRANLSALRSHIHQVSAIVSTASGCGVTLKDYKRFLDEDDELAATASHMVRKTCDVSELLVSLDLDVDKLDDVERVAVHLPCTLQHGQKLGDGVTTLLRQAGYDLVPVRDGHLCCGSAGTYSVLQSDMADELRERKLSALQREGPDVIASANVGCQMHLGAESDVPVKHWLELLR
jgi:glycolate oxidase iron-sulfur subunit